MSNFASFAGIKAEVEKTVGAEGLNLLINNAGMGKQTLLDKVTAQDLDTAYNVNTIAPIMLAQVILLMTNYCFERFIAVYKKHVIKMSVTLS